nr:hypothetical protein [Tanacetum cinerariifolium]
YLQHEHYALWEVIEFGDSYKDLPEKTAKDKGIAAILKTFGGNEATKKAKKNQLKQQYGNFKAEGSKTLEQTFNRLQAIVSHLEFMDVPIEQDDLNQKFLSSLALEWLVYTIVWRNKDDLDSMSLDDVYNHLKVCEPESYMAEEDEALKNHALVADEEEVPTEYALMAKSSSSSDNEVYDDSFCSKSCRKNTENLNTNISKINEELSDCETDLVLERDIELKDNKIEYLRNKLEEVNKEKESIDFKIEKYENDSKDLDRLLESKKLDKDKKGVGFNEYCAVPPPPAQVYSPPKKYLSWMGLPKFVDDTVTNYTRLTPSIDVSKSVSKEQEERWKSNNPSFFEQGGSSDNVVSKPMIKFVKESGCPNATKVNNTKNARKPTVKYAEMYRNTSQSPRVRETKGIGKIKNPNSQEKTS